METIELTLMHTIKKGSERIHTGSSINTKTGVSPTFPKGNTPFPTIVADKANFSQLENNLEKEIKIPSSAQ